MVGGIKPFVTNHAESCAAVVSLVIQTALILVVLTFVVRFIRTGQDQGELLDGRSNENFKKMPSYFKGETVRLEQFAMSDTYSMRGTSYGGYLILIYDKRGEIIQYEKAPMSGCMRIWRNSKKFRWVSGSIKIVIELVRRGRAQSIGQTGCDDADPQLDVW